MSIDVEALWPTLSNENDLRNVLDRLHAAGTPPQHAAEAVGRPEWWALFGEYLYACYYTRRATLDEWHYHSFLTAYAQRMPFPDIVARFVSGESAPSWSSEILANISQASQDRDRERIVAKQMLVHAQNSIEERYQHFRGAVREMRDVDVGTVVVLFGDRELARMPFNDFARILEFYELDDHIDRLKDARRAAYPFEPGDGITAVGDVRGDLRITLAVQGGGDWERNAKAIDVPSKTVLQYVQLGPRVLVGRENHNRVLYALCTWLGEGEGEIKVTRGVLGSLHVTKTVPNSDLDALREYLGSLPGPGKKVKGLPAAR